MKTRNGLVSNSSSASYTLKIYGVNKLEDLMCYLNDFYELVYSTSAIEELQKQINHYTELLKPAKGSNKYIDVYHKTFNGYIKQLKKDISFIKKNGDDPYQILKTMLKYHQLHVNEQKDHVEITNHSSMHNSFMDGPSQLFNAITTLLLSNNVKVTVETEYDS